MNQSNAWAAAFAFVGMCFAIAWANTTFPPSPMKEAKVVCIEQRGEWDNTLGGGTCKFTKGAP